MGRTSSKRQRVNQKLRKKRFIYICVAIVIFVGLLTILGFRHYNKLKNPHDLFIPKDKDKGEEDPDIDINGQFDRNTINILMVGFDRDKGRSKTESVFRTDTNILLSINLEKETVDMLSIPRDSYVTLANRGNKDKFNSAYVYGYIDGKDDKNASGYKNLLDTTKNLLGGIPIYYYIGVDMDVVVEIVEALGGVEIDVPADATDAKRGVHVKKGLQIMDGKTLLGYARHRRLRDGDIDRVRNQQNIIMSIFNTLKKSNMFKSLPKIYKSLMDNIDTNMDFNQLSALALFGKDLNKENIRMHMLPGDFGEYNHISYWIVNQKKRVELIEELFKIKVSPDKQDPLREVVESFYASISNNILEVGGEGIIVAEGSSNVNNHKRFNSRDIVYGSTNNEVAIVTGEGVVIGKSPGVASISVSIGGLSQSIDITVVGEKEPDEKDPEGKDPEEKEPGGKDPGGKDPDEKEPGGKDPGTKDPDEKEPIDKDPGDKDPGIKDPEEDIKDPDEGDKEEEIEYKG